jgi:sulfoxide reductase catalytic subunit YedY
MLCTEGWLHVVPYIGYPLSEILKRVEPTGSAKYVEFTSLLDPKQFRGQREITYIDWPYVEGLRIDEAMHPLTFVALGAYGRMLPKGLGAPIAVRVPWKFGTKSPKAVVRMRLMEQQPATIWPARYPKLHTFWGNVNPEGKSALFGRGLRERRDGDILSKPARQYNGYAEHVASLYAGMDLERMY